MSEADTKRIQGIVRRLKKLPPVRWFNAIGKIDTKDLDLVITQLDIEVQHALRLTIYAKTIFNGGTHNKAVKRQNAVTAKVRKDLGYSYPKSANFTF